MPLFREAVSFSFTHVRATRRPAPERSENNAAGALVVAREREALLCREKAKRERETIKQRNKKMRSSEFFFPLSTLDLDPSSFVLFDFSHCTRVSSFLVEALHNDGGGNTKQNETFLSLKSKKTQEARERRKALTYHPCCSLSLSLTLSLSLSLLSFSPFFSFFYGERDDT